MILPQVHLRNGRFLPLVNLPPNFRRRPDHILSEGSKNWNLTHYHLACEQHPSVTDRKDLAADCPFHPNRTTCGIIPCAVTIPRAVNSATRRFPDVLGGKVFRGFPQFGSVAPGPISRRLAITGLNRCLESREATLSGC